MKKKAFITGISGQDGSYLAEYLLSLNYEVHGIIRRNSTPEHQESRIHHLENQIYTYYGDVLDISCLIKLFTEIQPDEIYNLAAQSHVRISFDIPQLTTQINAFGAQNVLEAYRLCCPKAKYYQASSCLIAGTKVLVRKRMKRNRLGQLQEFLTLGTKNIEDIEVGDEVLSMDIKTSKKEYCKVKAIGNRIADDIFKINFSNNNFLVLSGNHPIYVIDKGYIRTDLLQLGDKVIQKRYNGLFGGIIRKGKNNSQIFGEEKAKIISKNCSIGQKNNKFIHPWKDKKFEEIYKNEPDKLKSIKKQMSESRKGNKPWNTDIYNSKNKKHKKSWEKAKKNISISNKKLWEDENFSKINIEKLSKRNKNTAIINKIEQEFLNFLNQICPNEFEYNEAGKLLRIERKIPDFVNINSKKKIIELDGVFWHSKRKEDDDKKDNIYKKNGYEVLRITDKEFYLNKNLVKNKIENFIHNPQIDIVEIISIESQNSSQRVYDIEVEKNHNFFAKGILVHNSEMFGNQINKNEIQDMTTQMIPVSPYGTAKLFAYNMTKIYRESYKLHACNGILFNHESPRRASNFVTNKIIKYVCQRKYNQKLELGNLDSSRDWGHSKDYVRAMHLILNQEKPRDIIVATGETRTVRDLCKYVFNDLLKLNYEDYVTQNEKFLRPNELRFLRGDNYEITKLGWKPEYTFESMIKEMMDFWIDEDRKKKYGI